MKTLPMGADNQEIISLLVQWTELLAQEKYSEALAMFQFYHHELDWTPELLESAVFTYGCPGYTREEAQREFGYSDCRVTSLLQNPDRDKILRSIQINYYDSPFTPERAKTFCLTKTDYEHIIGDIHYDNVPLDGKMSDLTAIFFIKRLDEETMTLSFYDLHVM